MSRTVTVTVRVDVRDALRGIRHTLDCLVDAEARRRYPDPGRREAFTAGARFTGSSLARRLGGM